MSRITLYLSAFAILSIAGLGLLAKWQYSIIQDLKTSQALLEAENESIKNQTNRYVNRPRTDDDVSNRLCAWWEKKRASDNKAKRGVPAESCP